MVAEVSDGRTALDKIQEFRPDVALLDYKMPDLDGLEVLQVITRDGLPTRVVLLSAFDEGSLRYRALAEGAAGYLTKEAGRDEIVAAVIKCARGGEYLRHRWPAAWPVKSNIAVATRPHCRARERPRSSR